MEPVTGPTLWGFFFCITSSILITEAVRMEPSVRVQENNVTVVEGSEAILKCSVEDVANEKEIDVVWSDSKGFMLTLDTKRLIDDQRMSVERPFSKDWNLHIRNVGYSDAGRYFCQVKTHPDNGKWKNTPVDLFVQVPPMIIDEQSSNNTVVREWDEVHLYCNATGHPQPIIRWYRQSYLSPADPEKIGDDGEILVIRNVTRDCGGAYICEADNGVKPKQTRKIIVNVQYPPEVNLPSAKMGQYPGKETMLHCKVTANPFGAVYWMKNGEDLSRDDWSDKFNIELYKTNDEEMVLSLRIKNVRDGDFGKYVCFAQNILGKDKESMLLYDYSIHETTRRPKPIYIPTFAKITTPEYIDMGGYDLNTMRPIDFDTSRRKTLPGYVTNGENVSAVKANNSFENTVGSWTATIICSAVCFTVKRIARLL